MGGSGRSGDDGDLLVLTSAHFGIGGWSALFRKAPTTIGRRNINDATNMARKPLLELGAVIVIVEIGLGSYVVFIEI